MYNFDMNALLGAFGDDPSKLADAFTLQLNEALAARRRKDQMHEKAKVAAQSWNIFVKDYFDLYKEKYPNAFVENYLLTEEDTIALLEAYISLLPEIEKYIKFYDNIAAATDTLTNTANNAINKVKPIKDKAIEKINEKTKENFFTTKGTKLELNNETFSDTMKKFLKDNGFNI